MSYKEDDADYIIANLNRANEILRASVRIQLEAQLAETEALEVAHGERIEKLTKLLLLAKDVIEKAAAMTGHPDVFNYLQEALAAINDSKTVEGLILCDAEPVATQWQHEDTGRTGFIESHLQGDFFKMNRRLHKCAELYAPRGTE